MPDRDRPWVMRTYAGHSSASASNALYRRNLDKGQTGLSVAFDLPTQTGYDPDHELARGEVGKVGVPISHIGDVRQLFDGIPLATMNTSMTINATAMWLLALYQVAAEEQALADGTDPAEAVRALAGTTQNDIIKEYLSRGTYAFPPAPSLRLITDMIAYTVSSMPKWNPINICSYHLQEAGATPVQEVAYALSTAVAVLDAVRDSGQVPPERFADVVARISFFVNAGVRFVEEMCKMRAFVQLWDELTRERYGVTDEKARRFRYGVQVNSLGLTEAQPENNVQRIVLEMLAVTLSKDARARAVQLPAWNEALGLPRPWDQQWSLRIQQVLAFESDLLEHEDLFEGSKVVEAKVAEIVSGARAEMARVADLGGAVAAVESGYMKSALVASHSARRARIESGQDVVVGVNRFESTEPNPLTADLDTAIQTVDADVEARAAAAVREWRDERDADPARRAAADHALQRLRGRGGHRRQPVRGEPGVRAGRDHHGGVGGASCAQQFGEYRAPTASAARSGWARSTTSSRRCARRCGRPATSWGSGCGCWSASPGWTGTATAPSRWRCGRATPVSRWCTRGSGSPRPRSWPPRWPRTCTAWACRCCPARTWRWCPRCWTACARPARATCRSSSAGSSPSPTSGPCATLGVAAVFTPKDFGLTAMMGQIVEVIRAARRVDSPISHM